MEIVLNRDCILECWIYGRRFFHEFEERTPFAFKKGTTFVVEDYSDEYYVSVDDEVYGDIYIPKLSCSLHKTTLLS